MLSVDASTGNSLYKTYRTHGTYLSYLRPARLFRNGKTPRLWTLQLERSTLGVMTHLDDLFAFLRFPSVSADSQFKPHVEACAEWVKERLQKAGLESRLIPTAGNPVVFGHSPRRPDRKTVLIYGHYDVQPADPLNLWETSDPFEPVLRDGRVIARGATDNKGQILAHI